MGAGIDNTIYAVIKYIKILIYYILWAGRKGDVKQSNTQKF